MGTRERLVELVAASGLSQAEIARRVEEHPTWVNNRLRDVADIKADDIPRLARAIGVPPAAFFPPYPAQDTGSPERSALQADPAIAEALSEAVLRVLAELPPRHRAELWDLAERLAASRAAAAEKAQEEAGKPVRKAIAERSSRYLARVWDELPNEEQDFLWQMVEARRRLHERDAGRQE